MLDLSSARTLPADADRAVLVGRVWRPDVAGPSVVAVRRGSVVDITRHAPTMRDLCERPDAVALVRSAEGEALVPLEAVLRNTPEATRDASKPWLLAPIDLQAIKAAGVTFARSMVERVMEEQAKGAPEKAEAIRATV
jgi:fumarylacetoacetate (FAA) hydrolase family protein